MYFLGGVMRFKKIDLSPKKQYRFSAWHDGHLIAEADTKKEAEKKARKKGFNDLLFVENLVLWDEQ